MIGAIIGDIAGSRFEFQNTSDYNFTILDNDSDFTDDTICTIAVADALLHNGDYQTYMRSWCRRYPHPRGEYGGYFLNWVMRPDPYPYNSFGNGSAMRVSPVAWLCQSEHAVKEPVTITDNLLDLAICNCVCLKNNAIFAFRKCVL